MEHSGLFHWAWKDAWQLLCYKFFLYVNMDYPHIFCHVIKNMNIVDWALNIKLIKKIPSKHKMPCTFKGAVRPLLAIH